MIWHCGKKRKLFIRQIVPICSSFSLALFEIQVSLDIILFPQFKTK